MKIRFALLALFVCSALAGVVAVWHATSDPAPPPRDTGSVSSFVPAVATSASRPTRSAPPTEDRHPETLARPTR